MLENLKFVQGAVAKKDLVPALTHFRIKDGRVESYNGVLALSGPIPLTLEAQPKAIPFIRAIQTCKDTIQMHLTPAGKLQVRSGVFKANIECLQEAFVETRPEGDVVELEGNLLGHLKAIEPFIAEDASKPWARGILLRGQSAFATNNVILVEKWLGYDFPVEVNIPRAAVIELLRIGEEPLSLQVAKNNVTFHFSNERWLRTQTLSLEWPDLARVLDKLGTTVAFPPTFWEALESLKPFVNELEQVYLSPGSVATHTDLQMGAIVEVPGLEATGCFNLHQLAALESIADQIDLSVYPAPCPFIGKLLRGAIVGMRF